MANSAGELALVLSGASISKSQQERILAAVDRETRLDFPEPQPLKIEPRMELRVSPETQRALEQMMDEWAVVAVLLSLDPMSEDRLTPVLERYPRLNVLAPAFQEMVAYCAVDLMDLSNELGSLGYAAEGWPQLFVEGFSANYEPESIEALAMLFKDLSSALERKAAAEEGDPRERILIAAMQDTAIAVAERTDGSPAKACERIAELGDKCGLFWEGAVKEDLVRSARLCSVRQRK